MCPMRISGDSPGSLLQCDEKLRGVGVLSSVRHRQDAEAVVLVLERLVRKTAAVDAFFVTVERREG